MSKETMIILQVCFIILLLSYTSSHNIQGLMKELPNGLSYQRWGGDGEAVQLEKG
ncbi:MAG: hypothetical protein ACKOBD_16150 [Chloroflexota bacterium]